MKKLFALLISAFLLVSVFAIPVSADEAAPFWVTHFNDGTAEGAGAIFTETDIAGTWWHHVAFAPVEGEEDVYEIVEFCIGDGNAYALTIPEGGFVYGINTGNNWPALFEQNNATGDGATGLWFDDADHAAMPDYTSENCSAAFTRANDWCVGLMFKITGLDLEGKTIPTSTPDVKWYEDAYVCTATIAPYTGETDTDVSEEESVSETVSEAVSEDGATSNENASAESESVSENATASEASETTVDEAEGGLSTGALIAIIAAGVVVIGAVILVIVKSKKK